MPDTPQLHCPASWSDLAELLGSPETSGTVALPAVVYADAPVTIPEGTRIDLLCCATRLRVAPGIKTLFSVPANATLHVAGSILLEPPFPVGEALFSVAPEGLLELDVALLAQAPKAKEELPQGSVVECRGTLVMGHCAAIEGWQVKPQDDKASGCAVRVSGESAKFFMGGGRITNCSTAQASSAVPGAAVQILEGACFTLSGGAIANNNRGGSEARPFGGGVYCDHATFKMTGGTIEGNAATHGGGVYCVGKGSVDVSGGRITANEADHRGGGIYSTGEVMLAGGDVSHNSAAMGGGVFNSGRLQEAGAVITANEADSGAGIYNRGSLAMEGGSIVKNAAEGTQGSGGGVFNTGRLSLADGTIAGNCALYTGGGIYNTRTGSIEIAGAGLSRNRALYGGGIYNASGRVHITQGDIVDNQANSTQYGGGGIYNTGKLECVSATIVHNASQGMGGGIYNTGTVLLGSSGLSHNAAQNGGGVFNRGHLATEGAVLVYNMVEDMGGGIVNTGSLTMARGTVAHNTARRGGGILNAGNAQVQGTLLGRNRAGRARDFYNYRDDGARGTFTLTLPENDPAYQGFGWLEEGAATTGDPDPSDQFVDDHEERLLSARPICEVCFYTSDGALIDTHLVAPGSLIEKPGEPGVPSGQPLAVFSGWANAKDGESFDFDTPVETDLQLVALYDEPVAQQPLEEDPLPTLGSAAQDGISAAAQKNVAAAAGTLHPFPATAFPRVPQENETSTELSPMVAGLLWGARAMGTVAGFVRSRAPRRQDSAS